MLSQCDVCAGKGWWLSKEGAQIPCRHEGLLYWVDVKPDGTWLRLNAPGRKGALRLESAGYGPIFQGAVADLRATLAAARGAGGA